MIELTYVREAEAEERCPEIWPIKRSNEHMIKVLPDLAEDVSTEQLEDTLDQSRLGKANKFQIYWRNRILEHASAEWCNGKERQIKASANQVTLFVRNGKEVQEVFVAECNGQDYMLLSQFLDDFKSNQAPQK